LSIDANGIVTVAANTPSGTYSITYQLCEANPSTGLNVSPSNCDTATATVVVNNPIDAVNDPSVTVASNNTVVTALNALTNDVKQHRSDYHQYQCNAINDRTIEH
jgi:hypothetical protein